MNSEQFGKHGLEVIGAVWLVIVAVQYLGRYFAGLDVDFALAYVVVLVITVLAAILKRSNGVVE